MKTIIRVVLGLLALVVVGVGGFVAYVAATGIPHYTPPRLDLHVEPTPERVARGKKFALLLCSDCHLDPETGQLTGKHLTDAPQFGELYSRNITSDPEKGIGTWTDGELAVFLRTGINRRGEYVPPYMVKLPLLSDEDLSSIIAFLRSDDALVRPLHKDPPGVSKPSFLTKFLSHVVFKPLPLPTAPIVSPPPEDQMAYGRYLASALQCFACHSADFKTMNELQPERSEGFFGGGNPLLNLQGQTVYSANLTPDEETGIGKWSQADFVRAVRQGFAPGNRLLRYPMVPMPTLTEADAADIHAYLRTVPVLHNPVQRSFPPTPAPATSGVTAYHAYGCNGCHGENGVGVGDVRRAAADFPDDASLTAWIRDAPSIRPGTKMPRWDGIIREQDYPVLVSYVRELCKRGG